MNTQTRVNISTLKIIEQVAAKNNLKAFVWGGFVSDIYTGKILREHDDVEHFIEDLHKNISLLEEKFQELGWETKVLENGDFKIIKGEAKAHFGHIEINNDVATWHHNGNKGHISFPKSWLNSEKVKFMDFELNVVEPEFQYTLKLNPHFMNPEWNGRDKDKFDIDILKNLIVEKGVKEVDLEGKMESIEFDS